MDERLLMYNGVLDEEKERERERERGRETKPRMVRPTLGINQDEIFALISFLFGNYDTNNYQNSIK